MKTSGSSYRALPQTVVSMTHRTRWPLAAQSDDWSSVRSGASSSTVSAHDSSFNRPWDILAQSSVSSSYTSRIEPPSTARSSNIEPTFRVQISQTGADLPMSSAGHSQLFHTRAPHSFRVVPSTPTVSQLLVSSAPPITHWPRHLE